MSTVPWYESRHYLVLDFVLTLAVALSADGDPIAGWRVLDPEASPRASKRHAGPGSPQRTFIRRDC